MLDTHRTNYIDQWEFRRVVDAYGMNFKKGRPEDDEGVLYNLNWEDMPLRLRVWRVVKHPWYQRGMTTVLLLNLVTAAFATEHIASMDQKLVGKALLQDSYMQGIMWATVLTQLILNADIIVKISVFNWTRAMEKTWRRYDVVCGTVILICLIVLAAQYQHDRHVSQGVVRLCFLFVILRSVRLTSQSQRMAIVARSISLLLAPFTTFLGILFVVIYVFATIGIECFGGLIYKGNPALNGTAFATEADVGFYANNFNDYASSMVTCWELLIVNNWFIIMDGFVAVSGTQWSRVYFLCYYFVMVVVVLNLFTSFVLEAVTKVDTDEWTGTPHGTLFETPFSSDVTHELKAHGTGRWRMQHDMRRSFVNDPFEDFQPSPMASSLATNSSLRGRQTVGSNTESDSNASIPRMRRQLKAGADMGYERLRSAPDRPDQSNEAREVDADTRDTYDFDEESDEGRVPIGLPRTTQALPE